MKAEKGRRKNTLAFEPPMSSFHFMARDFSQASTRPDEKGCLAAWRS
jgi:hypothetical protein